MTTRWKTREVMVGNVGVGAHHPIRIQSMTTSNTRDVEATINQVLKLQEAGCEIVRITVQGMKEAEACESIKNGLIQRGCTIPLVADIHFFPPAALKVVDFVDKVRINPGNFADKRASFKTIEYDDQSYSQELEKIEEKFSPLVEKCKRLKRAMRIGTNHGSLSDRIMNRYGDTPKGMLESALEFARICRRYDFHDFMFSMKSSNPQVMIQAYRLLVAEMIQLGWDYPLHLGVTEAGEGEDGRIKSAMGIGTLLLDGIGDTIRVSLTEDPWHEIDPCQRLIKLANEHTQKKQEQPQPCSEGFRNRLSIQRREVEFPKKISMHRDGTVFTTVREKDLQQPNFYQKLGFDTQFGRPKHKISSSDCLILDLSTKELQANPSLNQLQEIGVSLFSENPLQQNVLPILTLTQASQAHQKQVKKGKFALDLTVSGQVDSPFALILKGESPQEWSLLETLNPAIVILAPVEDRLQNCRQFFEWLQKKNMKVPVILHFNYSCSQEDLIIQTAAEYGSLFCDGWGEGIWIDGPYEANFLRQLSFNILQAARMRTFKTDFISCPSCGRTLFDLQDVTKRIRSRTAHLPGVKIAIMGCIVNGPGEMADAHFGYVGSKPGKIDLYVGKQCVEKDIDFAEADERLVDLIKSHGRWQDPCQ